MSGDDKGRAPSRSAASRLMARHEAVCAALFRALSAGEWDDAAHIWETSLTRSERVRVLGGAIAACAVDDAVTLMEAALGDLTRPPGVPFRTITEEAASWVALASTAEIKIYLLACFKALPKSERVAFLGAAQRVVLK